MKMTVKLKGYGNPDYAQYADVSPQEIAEVASLADAASKCRSYIQEWNLGGGNWGKQSGIVSENGKPIARVSYNGRVWNMDGKELTPTT